MPPVSFKVMPGSFAHLEVGPEMTAEEGVMVMVTIVEYAVDAPDVHVTFNQ